MPSNLVICTIVFLFTVSNPAFVYSQQESAKRYNQSEISNEIVLDGVLGSNIHAITRGPYLQVGTPTSLVVRWRSLEPYPGVIYFGTHPDSLYDFRSSEMDTVDHEVHIQGLIPNTKYFYAVGVNDSTTVTGEHFYFITSPQSNARQKSRIWILGDSGTTNANGFAVRDAYYEFTDSTHTNLWIMLGDNAYNHGTDEEFQIAVFDKFPTMLSRSVLWSCLGNHDWDDPESQYFQVHTFPTQGEAGGVASGTEAYYSFNYDNVHFISLDSWLSSRHPDSSMANWLRDDLQANSSDWTVAFWHHPPYTKGSHDSDTEPQSVDMRENILPILEAHGVDLVFGGNSHSYERSFLIDGHYAVSDSFNVNNIIDAGSGDPTGDGAYIKSPGSTPHEGSIFVVAGSSGRLDADPPSGHPAMYTSQLLYGSVVLDVDDLRLDVQFLDKDGTVTDAFAIVKENNVSLDDDQLSEPTIATTPVLETNYPNPFNPSTRFGFRIFEDALVNLKIFDAQGRLVKTIINEKWLSSNRYERTWNGTDEANKPVASGIYFYRLEVTGDLVHTTVYMDTRKMLLVR